MEEQGIIREVREATPWCSPMVIAYKQNNDIRVCQDLWHLNQYVRRPHMQIPTLDEMNAKLNGGAFFATLDCQGGFHQITIAKTSQLLLTFSTLFGRYCYQRLPFGLVSAPEAYQKIMHDLVADVDGAICYIDDLIVYGKTRDEHNAALERVMQRLSYNGLRLNLAKCNFAKQSIFFLGYTWNSSGMRPGDEKLQAIKNMEKPKNGEELRSFLDLAANLDSNNIPHFSTLVNPLWSLPNLGPLEWDVCTMQVFENLQQELVNIQHSIYFDPKKKSLSRLMPVG